MITQPEALRLADELDADSNIIGYDKHAAELRRLHAEVEELRGALDEAMWHVKYKELKAVNESDTALLRQAYLLCDEINKMPHVRGSINGMAVQLQYALRERLNQGEKT